jgi:hypothetical protein
MEILGTMPAERLGLELAVARTCGYDALRGTERFQTKSRAYAVDVTPNQLMSRIKLDASYDTALLVLQNNATLDAREMWEAPFAAVKALLETPGSTARERGALRQKLLRRQAAVASFAPTLVRLQFGADELPNDTRISFGDR